MNITHNVMKQIISSLLAAMAISPMILSCSSTEVIDEPAENSDIISFSVSAPDAYSFPATKASDGLQLRYIGKLYKQGVSQNDYTYMAREELLAKDGSVLTFHAEPGTYVVRVFADYIGADISSKETKNSAKGGFAYDTYGDKFYITEDSKQSDIIEMKAIQAGDDSSNPQYYEGFCNINNDDYDCFAGSTKVFNKTAMKYDESLTLKRAVSKIRVVASNTANWAQADNINITKFSYYNKMDIKSLESSSQNTISTSNLKKDVFTFTPSGKSNEKAGELFYFYTFAFPGFEGLKEISFNITSNDENYEFASVTIASQTLQPKANYIYNVKGNFLSPTKYPEDLINITVDKNSDWTDSDKAI